MTEEERINRAGMAAWAAHREVKTDIERRWALFEDCYEGTHWKSVGQAVLAAAAPDRGCEVCGYDCAGMPAPPAYCPVQWRGELERLTVKPREPLLSMVDGEPTGYFESDRDWLTENRHTAVWLLENLDRIKSMIKEAHS